MTAEIVWVMLSVTALSIDNFVWEVMGFYDTISECYVASTQVFWENMPINQEALCIRVEDETFVKQD